MNLLFKKIFSSFFFIIFIFPANAPGGNENTIVLLRLLLVKLKLNYMMEHLFIVIISSV